jgi:hypothetical protein
MLFFNYRRGLIFGIWASTQSVGNIAGALMVASVVNYGYQVNILNKLNKIFIEFYSYINLESMRLF